MYNLDSISDVIQVLTGVKETADTHYSDRKISGKEITEIVRALRAIEHEQNKEVEKR